MVKSPHAIIPTYNLTVKSLTEGEGKYVATIGIIINY